MLSNNVKQRIPFLLAVILFLYTFKPSMFFKPNGKPRSYGFGTDEEGYKRTVYTFQFVVFITAVLITVLK
jgi:hypothetical protein